MKKGATGSLFLFGTPREIRTPDQLVRSQLLYPAELWARGIPIIYGYIERVTALSINKRRFTPSPSLAFTPLPLYALSI